tara:strand:- start:729 stop:1976 length:1248 start_codon:yes stop_codon:yes gene_type:complete
MYLTNNSNKIAVFLFLYFSLLIGFYFDENSSGGAYPDLMMRIEIINSFKNDFLNTLLNYDKFPERHTPVIHIIISILNNLGLDMSVIRFLHLNLLPLLVLISYKCLVLKFPYNNKNVIFFICCVFFLSPSLRSISIWPDSRLLGFILFMFSVYYFLKFKNDSKFKYCIYNNLFLVLSAYLSPNFSLFFLYFLIYYFYNFGFSKKLLIVFIFNSILSIPMLYYLFVLKVNFLATTAIMGIDFMTRINPFNKILIISSLMFFYVIPLIFNNLSKKDFIINFKISQFLYSIVIFICSVYFFDYLSEYTGGGIFFRLSYFLFDNEFLFFVISFISILLILNILKINFNNILLLLILILSNPQLTIYHKYYDPLLLILFFLFFDFKFPKEKIINKRVLYNIYIFYSFLLCINFGRYFFNY